jgi:hypothetical protein
MQDRPTREELLRGITRFLESELVPILKEPLRFHTRVAANLLKIIERELEMEEDHLLLEAQSLRQLMSSPTSRVKNTLALKQEIRDLNRALCLHIRSGRADQDPRRQEVLAHLKETLIRKLEIANPPMTTRALTRY